MLPTVGNRRVRVLEIVAEGGGFDLDAELGSTNRAVAFYAHAGGPTGWEAFFDEAPDAPTVAGPLTWEEVLQRFLRPHSWLEQHPRVVHPAVFDLVRGELAGASSEVRARWAAVLPAGADK